MAMHIERRALLKSFAAAPVLLSPLAAGCAKHGASSTKAGTLNIGQISNSVAFFPLFVAEEKGYFKDEGIKLGDRPRLGTGAKVAAALKSGSIDLGAGVLTDAFNLAESESGTTRVVSSLVTEYYVDIVVGKDFGGPAAKASLEARTKALVGRKIGITGPGSGTEALVDHLFEGIGKKAKTDATLVNLGSAATSAIGALKSGRVDALSFFQPIGQQAEADGSGRILISPARGDVTDMTGALHGVVFSTQKLLQKKAKEVKGFQSAIKRAQQDVQGDPQKVRELLEKYLKDTDPKALDALVPILRREMPQTPAVEREPYETARRFHLESGLVEKAPEFGDIKA
ncbi:nitrate ABC transporter substrate-binding protein [Streptomyces abyssalis]|uniref:Nitrate ABC transporter substrate-binding protein n=1 Tax=Streptomyces abyssalis TaxID=933944 RepID=A0A1E7JUS9_9ACTN|nr:ABC transporter substrate-binding protein [Streptomyces abyssalis]OEU89316.1 nitrate ABC transporter substrate-binding protein [Streptomyces abyssalis]OEU93711.1 nitrate ABC transporter substrate-binding protein [Streptomyces abyssalis]OEV04416.1 nitrate ABC transporter substrate-binding protein [Streptomyces nanshensis]